MNDYNKHSFKNDYDEINKIRKYYIKVGKDYIEVSKEVYGVIYNSYRKQLRDNIKDNKVLSLDKENKYGLTLLDIVGETSSVEDKDKSSVEEVLEAINELDDADRELITELLLCQKTERELANEYQISQQQINRKKQRIIKKLKKVFK